VARAARGGAPAALPDLDLDADVGRPAERDPDFAGEDPAPLHGEQAGGTEQRAVAVGDPGAAGRRLQAGHGQAHQVVAAVRLAEQHGGARVDQDGGGRGRATRGEAGGRRTERRDKLAPCLRLPFRCTVLEHRASGPRRNIAAAAVSS
jgi:hypothetical protein